MENMIFNAGLIGCGDFLRWEIDKIKASKHLKVKYTYDTDKAKREWRASQLAAIPVDSPDVIFDDQNVDVVLIFTPPFARTDYFKRAALAKKHIITTKPFALTVKEGEEMYSLVNGKVECAVFYRRSGDPVFEKIKDILDSGEIGHLALYKEDWFHHYPHWSKWALEADKNDGPFMDAMIHNLNISRYLAGNQEVKEITFYSDNFVQDLSCNDTECMRIIFNNGAGSYLFITWAADLEIYDTAGNDREHIGIMHLVTSQGWMMDVLEENGKTYVTARKEDHRKRWEVSPLPMTCYDDFVQNVIHKHPQNSSMDIALDDLRILEEGKKKPGRP
ncbi:MAG TPA: Gfo/Idh/MocA family oxidoreductase [Bacteroidales bacterium]|nr:Gfo/Idh/MocA family oxidoreductase [Bacteroidales bacterium]